MSLVDGKYTYYRKKKLVRKKLGSSSHFVTPANAGLQNQPVEKSRKRDVVGDVAENVELKPAFVTSKKNEMTKGQTELSVNARPLKAIVKSNSPSDHSLAKNASRRKVMKIVPAVHSMSFP